MRCAHFMKTQTISLKIIKLIMPDYDNFKRKEKMTLSVNTF